MCTGVAVNLDEIFFMWLVKEPSLKFQVKECFKEDTKEY